MMIPKLLRWIFFRKNFMKTTVDAIRDKSGTLIDIREQYELEDYGFIEHAKHIPMGDVPAKLEEIKVLPKPLVIFCKAGGRASKVIEFLQENGIEDCYNGGGYVDVNEILTSSDPESN